MKHTPQKTSPRLVFLNRLPLIVAASLATVIGWLYYSDDRLTGPQSERWSIVEEKAANALEKAKTPARGQTVTTAHSTSVDPHLLRPAPPMIPAITTPEAEQMVMDLQRAYPHGHRDTGLPSTAIRAQVDGESESPSKDVLPLSERTLATLSDADYAMTALPQLADPRTPAELMNVLYADLAKRPDPIRLRTLFVIAGIESHPLAAAALGDLQSILNADYQQDWLRWTQAISVQLVRETRGARSNDCRSH
jgi:hypothetical protein